MKSFRIRILFGFSILFFSACSEGLKWEEPLDESIEQDTFYLISRAGDTIPTGVHVEVIQPGIHFKGKEDGFKKENLGDNLQTEISIKKSATIAFDTLYTTPFYIDSVNAIWDWNIQDDTLEHPDPIRTKGKTVRMQISDRFRVSAPNFKENAIADIQFLSIDQGLISSSITDILHDSRGITWLATDRGLIRFDGAYVVNFTVANGLPKNSISCLYEGLSGEIWMGFEGGGFAKYDGNELTIFDQKSCGFGWLVQDLMVDEKGLVWIGTLGAGVCTYDGEHIQMYDRTFGLASHKLVSSFVQDKEGNPWFINFGAGIWRQTEEDLRGLHINAGISSRWIASMYIDSKDRVWLGGAENGFFLIQDDSVSQFRLLSDTKSYILDFVEDSKGGVWIATSLQGILHFDGETITQYGTDQGLSSNYVNCLRSDAYGRIWAGTTGGGLVMINTKSFEFMTQKHGLPSNRVNGMCEKNGKTYYATDGGLVVESGDSLIFAATYGDPNEGVRVGMETIPQQDVVVTDEGVIFTNGINFGVARYLPELDAVRKYGGNSGGMPQNPSAVVINQNGIVYAGAQDVGRLWAFTDTSIHRWDEKNNFAHSSTTDMVVDLDNQLWMASKNQGVLRFDSTHWFYYTTNEGLSSNSVRELYVDRENRIWIATDKGLDYIEDGEIHTVDFGQNINPADVQSIIQDNEGGYWIGLFDGLVNLEKVTDSDEWALENYRVIQISKNDGLINSSFLVDAMYLSQDGRLHIGTEGGLLTKEIRRQRSQSFKPRAQLLSLEINGERLDFNRVRDKEYVEKTSLPKGVVLEKSVPFYNYPTTLELPYSCNHLTFHYEGTYTGAETPQRLQYEYYVKGLDEGWIPGPKEQKADYRNLPYGEFEFHLRSFIDPENPSEEFIYPFTILPPWYHTWWARIIFLLVFGLVIWLIIRFRTRALLTRQEELEETVEERTAELKEKHEQLEESHQEIRDSIAYAKRIQSAILPPAKLVKEYLPQSFILYKPKDVVAGDFYWMAHAENEILFAAADCTGHGVPGAMVSVMCNGALNRAVNEFGLSEPGQILDKTRELVIQEFEKSEDEVKDGMDIALCSLSGNILKYAGAHNALWIVRKGTDEIEEVKADKQPIGKYAEEKPFTTHNIELKEGDSFYIFSDGYADQFGGEKGKKFKSANFKRLLLSMQNEPMERQSLLLDEAFEDWRKDVEQVDDVCVIGIRV